MIRLGIIGCGGMAGNFVSRFDQLGDRVKVTAAADVELSRAEAVADAFNYGTKATADYREILSDIDAALLVLPHDLHHPVTMDCLRAGKHVLVEKPMANTEADCLEMIAESRRQQRVLMVAYVMRYHPLVLKLKELLDSGKFGRCFHLSLWTEQYTHFPEGHWSRTAARLGGGQLFSHGCHYVDLLLWFLGKPVDGCHVGTNYCTPWMEKEGTSDLFMRFESGAVGYHMGTWGARGARIGYAYHAHCEEGMLEADFAAGRIVLHRFKLLKGTVEPHLEGYRTDDGVHGSETVLYKGEVGKQTDKETAHFIDCIEQGIRPETDGPRSLQSLRAIWRMYEAERRGAVADLRGLELENADALAP